MVDLSREEEFLPEEQEPERALSRRIHLQYRKALMKTWDLAGTLYQTGLGNYTRLSSSLIPPVLLAGRSPALCELFAVLKKAFALLETIPILRIFTSSDYDLLSRRIPAEKFQEHLASDRVFIGELIAHCKSAGIPIVAQPEEVSGLLYALVLTILHRNELGPNSLNGIIDVLLELVAAFCLGEVVLRAPHPGRSTFQQNEGSEK